MTPLDEARWHKDRRFAALGIAPGELLGEPVGCDRCGGTGYIGRRAVFEIIVVTEAIGRQVVEGAGERAIETAARADGMTTMIEDGIRKVREGLTSFDEVLRVTASR